jgi:hypothetical protein
MTFIGLFLQNFNIFKHELFIFGCRLHFLIFKCLYIRLDLCLFISLGAFFINFVNRVDFWIVFSSKVHFGYFLAKNLVFFENINDFWVYFNFFI